MNYTAKKIESQPVDRPISYKLEIPQYVTALDGSQVQIQSLFLTVTRESLTTQLEDIQSKLAACDAADNIN